MLFFATFEMHFTKRRHLTFQKKHYLEEDHIDLKITSIDLFHISNSTLLNSRITFSFQRNAFLLNVPIVVWNFTLWILFVYIMWLCKKFTAVVKKYKGPSIKYDIRFWFLEVWIFGTLRSGFWSKLAKLRQLN